MRRRAWIIPMLLAAAVARGAAGAPPAPGSEVVLRRVALVRAEDPVRLHHVAELSGGEAIVLRDVIIEPDPASRLRSVTGSFTLDVSEVRAALSERGRVHWGRLALRGSHCVVRPHPAPPAPADLQLPSGDAPAARDRILPGTVGAHVAQAIASLVGVGTESLRFTFEPDDRAFLGQALGARRVEARPTGLSDAMGVRVTVYDGDRVADARLVRAGVEVRREVGVLKAAMRRAERIAREDLLIERRWISPAERIVPPGEAVGRVVRAHIEAGEIITEGDVESPLAAERGDRVTVHCVSGPVVVRTEARASRDVRDGELVELMTLDGKRTITARMSGNRRAVALVDAHPPAIESEDTP